MRVVGQATSWQEAVPLVRARRPDLILLDSDETDAVRRLAEACAEARIIALSVREPERNLLPFAEAGIAGYVTRDQSLTELVEIVQSVARGELPCSPRMAAGLLRHVASLAGRAGPTPVPCQLTPRELEIVELIDYGLSNREIAQRLYIEISTVKNHVHNILEKLHVGRRADAVACMKGQAPAALAPVEAGRR
jgi:DNA-binding NarL/FixJ family response regulator